MPCAPSDVGWVRDLRERVLRPQVEAVSTWDGEVQARRFARDFDHAHAWVVWDGGARVGCVSLRTGDGHAHLSSLYVEPHAQGRGIGAAVIRVLQDGVAATGLPVRLTVLRGSPAVRLYERSGFVVLRTDRWESHMSWTAPAT